MPTLFCKVKESQNIKTLAFHSFCTPSMTKEFLLGYYGKNDG